MLQSPNFVLIDAPPAPNPTTTSQLTLEQMLTSSLPGVALDQLARLNSGIRNVATTSSKSDRHV